MTLFQDEITQEQTIENKNNNQDIFSQLGYDDIIKQRQEIRQQRIDDESQWVKNIVSPDKINEWKNKGAMTAIEVFNRKNADELMPYMGTIKQGTKSFDIKKISDKLQTGQTITPEEREKFENFVLNLAEIQTRGYSFGGGAMNIGLETLPFMAEFAVGLLTTGGTASLGATSSKLSTEVLKKSLKKQILEGASKTALNVVHPRTLAFTATRLPQQVRLRMGDIMLSDSVAISPEGQAILTESEDKPFTAFMKALTLTNIEVASEMSGAMLVRPLLTAGGKLGKVIASPVLKHLPKGFADNFVELTEKITNMPFAKAVDELGWNGILEEMGEERIGDLMQFALNLDGQEGYSFEQLLDAVFPPPEQLAQEALSFGVTGIGMNIANKGLKKVSPKYTKDGFLIDAGIFRVAGYDSYIDGKIREELEKRGKSEDEIDNAINFSTHDDKVQFLKETKTQFDSKKNYDQKEFEKELKRAEIEDKAYEKLMQGGVNQDVAFANARLFGQFFKKYGANDIKAFDEWFNKFDVQYNVPANNANTLFQSAMYKSPKKTFDEFYDQVQSNINPKQKAYYTQTTKDGVNIDIFHDVVRHDEKKHSLSKDEWNELFDVIDNEIDDKLYANKSYYKGTPILLKIKSGEKYFGVSMEVFPDRTIITTAFKSTAKGVDTWIEKDKKKSAKTTAPNHQSRSSIAQGNNVILGQTLTDIINHVKENINPDVNNHKEKTYFQEDDDVENEKLIAGFTYPQVMEKCQDLWAQAAEADANGENKGYIDALMAKAHVLEDALNIALSPEKFSNEEQNHEVMLNAYYIMHNQEIPEDYIDIDSKSQRTYNDLKEIHNKRKEKKEKEYYGYFTENQDKNIITIMQNSNASTALHELGHLFLNGLNELAKTSEQAQKQLDAVNKWLGSTDGGYTVAQQEKFARSFEAYLYKGKAPNNSLKQVFENFKEWLKSVYEDITKLVNKGADISDEVQELFDNMFGNDEYYQELKEANELLKRVKNIARKERATSVQIREDKELDDYAKKHKEAAYEILSVGTGKSINYLKTIFETNSKKSSFGKKREAIEELIDKVDDKITVSGGMREEWKEFFTDTGVSYENDEIEGDRELVEQALDVIINKSYGINNVINELDKRAEYFEKAIDDADRQYKLLLNSYRNGNRNVALAAVYEWLDGLNSEIRQDYEDRFIYDTGIIERNENVNKFAKAKRQILSKAMELDNQLSINQNQKYQEVVKEIMKNLNFLNPYDKARLTTNILDVPSTEFLMSSIDNILDIAKTLEDINFRKKLENEIHKELQKTKNVKKNGRSVGKYDYKTNKLFEELRQLDRLSPEAAQMQRLENKRFADFGEKGASFKDKFINKFLSYKSGGRTFADTELMKELYDAIVKIKLAGKSAKSELDLLEKLDETKDIEELINIVQNKKEANIALKGYISGVANLESAINAIFNKNIKDRYAAEILYAETQAQAWQHEQKQKFEREVAKIYNLPEWCWDKKILDYLSEKHTYSEIRRKYDANGEIVKKRIVDRTLTKMDIIQAYIWLKMKCLKND